MDTARAPSNRSKMEFLMIVPPWPLPSDSHLLPREVLALSPKAGTGAAQAHPPLPVTPLHPTCSKCSLRLYAFPMPLRGSLGYTAVLWATHSHPPTGRDRCPTTATKVISTTCTSDCVFPWLENSQELKSSAWLLRPRKPARALHLPKPLPQPHVPTLVPTALALSPSWHSCPTRPSLGRGRSAPQSWAHPSDSAPRHLIREVLSAPPLSHICLL